jgi:hypothetical protein
MKSAKATTNNDNMMGCLLFGSIWHDIDLLNSILEGSLAEI